MPDVWRFIHCGGCGSMFLADRPDDESLPCAYATYYTHDVDHDDLTRATTHGLLQQLINGYLNARFCMQRNPSLRVGALLFRAVPPLRMKLDVYGRHVPVAMCTGQTRLLDIGCGNGAFLGRAREMGIEVHGCEPDSGAVEACRRLGLDVAKSDIWRADYPEQCFDLITLNHVIEHVADAPRLLRKLRGLLRPGGILWLALPNPDALGLKLFGRGWKGLHPPFHLLIPSQRILHAWLQQAGFEDAHPVRRGAQSPSIWRESVRIAQREGTAPSGFRIGCVRLAADLLCSLTPRWGEETIIVASRPIH